MEKFLEQNPKIMAEIIVKGQSEVELDDGFLEFKIVNAGLKACFTKRPTIRIESNFKDLNIADKYRADSDLKNAMESIDKLLDMLTKGKE